MIATSSFFILPSNFPYSPPYRTTSTVINEGASCSWVWLAAWVATCAEAFADEPAALDAAVRPAIFGATIVGTPAVVPTTEMLPFVMTCAAATLKLPETRIPHHWH
ncbi:MAG TPA: hypothetical protein VE860_08920 [Chthoniobacterales bacterium]|nr:hypothetical protein [Chthoniobacterales bacterium]